MCLDRLIGKDERPSTGWKVLRTVPYGGSYCSPLWDVRRPLPAGRWLAARPEAIRTDKGEPYTAGWHVFRSRRAAEVWRRTYGYGDTKIVRVRYLGVLARGYEGRYQVDVASWLWIEKDQQGKEDQQGGKGQRDAR